MTNRTNSADLELELRTTVEQVARLENALFAMRRESKGNSDVLDAIATTQYQEIQWLRKQIDSLCDMPVDSKFDSIVSVEREEAGIEDVPG